MFSIYSVKIKKHSVATEWGRFYYITILAGT